jgi:hypothetical protein
MRSASTRRDPVDRKKRVASERWNGGRPEAFGLVYESVVDPFPRIETRTTTLLLAAAGDLYCSRYSFASRELSDA